MPDSCVVLAVSTAYLWSNAIRYGTAVTLMSHATVPDLDHGLVERCLAGDDAAWEQVVRMHSRRVYNLCLRFTGRFHEAEDLSQEVFLRLYRNLSQYRAESGTFTTWLTALTRNLLIDHYRRSR